MLIKTIEELKQYCSIVELNLNIDSLQSYLRKAERYIKECLGATYYATFKTAYDADTLSAAQKNLLPYIQDPLVNIALFLWINGGQLQVSDKGVQLDHGGTTKTAFQWQIDNWKDDLESSGFDALDDLLAYLEENKATFTAWAGDATAFTINKKFFNPDAISLSRVVAIGNSRRTFKALSPYLEMANDMRLKPTLGEGFYNELKAALTAGTMTADQKLLLPMLQKVEVYFAMCEAYGPLRFTIKSNGIRVFEALSTIENQNVQKAISANDALQNAKAMEGYGLYYLKNLVAYLNKNANSFTTWKNSDLYVDPDVKPESSTYIGDAWVGL
jgi:hypothetical protein